LRPFNFYSIRPALEAFVGREYNGVALVFGDVFVAPQRPLKGV
jgi:hypothetical protein